MAGKMRYLKDKEKELTGDYATYMQIILKNSWNYSVPHKSERIYTRYINKVLNIQVLVFVPVESPESFFLRSQTSIARLVGGVMG